jgi:hypothetical protein
MEAVVEMDSLSMEGGVAVVEYKSRISNEKEKGTIKKHTIA